MASQNGASVMACTGYYIVMVWISVIEDPVVEALQDFILDTLKEVDYFAHGVQFVRHKINGASKKIPGIWKADV